MADLYGLDASGLPPEYQAQLRRANRQQMIAESLMAQANDPIQTNQMAGGYVVPVSPFQGLSKIAQAYMGAKAMQRGDEAFKGIADKVQGDRQAAIAKVQGALAPMPLPDSSAGPPATMERPIEQRTATLEEALLHQDPLIRSFATSRLGDLRADKTLQETREIRAQEKADAAALEEKRDKRELEQQQERDRQAFERQKELREIIQATTGGRNPYLSPVQTNQGIFSFDHRSGQYTPGTFNGQQLFGAQYDPTLQGSIAKAKTGGEAQAKREHNMTGMGDTIDAARRILSGQDGSLPTGSGLGVARDAIAGFAGVATDGSIQAQKLKAVAGALTSKMPRMEGPQSDKDTALYKEMAAEVGNASVPVARRLAALAEVERLWRQYEPTKGNTRVPAKLNIQGPAAKTPSIESLLEKYK